MVLTLWRSRVRYLVGAQWHVALWRAASVGLWRVNAKSRSYVVERGRKKRQPTSRSSGRLLHLARSRRLQLVFKHSFQSCVFSSIMVSGRGAAASGAPSFGAVRRRLTPALGDPVVTSDDIH
jgi:hypothetical protein